MAMDAYDALAAAAQNALAQPEANDSARHLKIRAAFERAGFHDDMAQLGEMLTEAPQAPQLKDKKGH